MDERLLNNEQENKLIRELREKGTILYSYSRINAFNTCKYEYYKTYLQKNRGIGNCYSEMGSFVHGFIENAYRQKQTETDDFTRELCVKLAELELLDMDFPNEKIKNAFTNDMIHFTDHFKKLDGEFVLEKAFIIEIEGHWFIGYIDAVRLAEGEIHVIDWKTSSKFSSKKIVEAGRQLALYKLALEKGYDIEVHKVMWNMLKYVYVCHERKNKSIMRKMVNRGKIVSTMKDALEKDMKQQGLSDVEIFLYMEQALATNSLDVLPEFIKEKYWLEDCYLEYEVNEQVINELHSYIKESIAQIESKDVNNIEEWRPLNVEKESFYCNTLCNHRETCPFIKEYNRKQSFK